MAQKDNLQIYNLVRNVPSEALKTIGAGRLKGMNDINPMWRIKVMTEQFGPCGLGWRDEITKQWLETYGDEVKCFCNINLYIKVDGEWSEAIPGTGGSSFVSAERNGPYVSDEAHKMALTDALSVAMKALGVGASIYFEKDADYGTKYEPRAQATQQSTQAQQATGTQQLIPAEVMEAIKKCQTKEQLAALFKSSNAAYQQNPNFVAAFAARKNELK